MLELPEPASASPTMPAFPETRYQAVLAAVRNPKRSSGGLVLVLSLAAFVLLQQNRSPRALVVLVGVLLFHELGHYAGMRVFGYSDMRMFFIPFFGAAVSGKPRGAAPWKEGVVLLLGPLPGIAAAFVLALLGLTRAADGAPLGRELAISLVSINAFNLLPLAGLDGSRLLQHVLFSRRRWLEIAFQLCASLALAACALALGSFALGMLAVLMLVILPYRWRLLGKARELREAGPALPFDARELNDDVGRAVFTAANGLTDRQSTKSLAAAMEQLVDATNARAPSLGASFALGSTWFLGLVFAAVTLVLVYGPPRPRTSGVALPALVQPLPTHPEPPRLRLGGQQDFELKPPTFGQ